MLALAVYVLKVGANAIAILIGTARIDMNVPSLRFAQQGTEHRGTTVSGGIFATLKHQCGVFISFNKPLRFCHGSMIGGMLGLNMT
jgi:hypothetical protein